MVYMGGKVRIAKHILPIMLSCRHSGQYWVEPFVGGGNVIDKVTGPRIGADANRWTIEALKSIRDHVDDLPRNNTEFTEDDYRKLRHSDDYKHKGFASFAYSFGAKHLGTWAREREGSDYVARAYRSAVRQSRGLQGVNLIHCDYLDLVIPPNSVIYCDPPYANTTGYVTGKFDSFMFWEWCRYQSQRGHTVFVSEYVGPEWATVVWERRQSVSVNNVNGHKRHAIEKLFKVV